MIQNILNIIITELDGFLKQHFNTTETKVVLNNVVAPDGTIPATNQNKIVLSFLHFEDTPAVRNGTYKSVDLTVLVSANFNPYGEGLKMLDACIAFFHQNPIITIPEQINTLQIIPKQLTLTDMQSIWTGIGAGYMPSVIYQIRTTLSIL